MFYSFSTASGLTARMLAQSTAASLAALWAAQAVSSDGQHVLTSFGDPSSLTALTYNLFADKLLSTNLVPSSVSSTASTFHSLLRSAEIVFPAIHRANGVPEINAWCVK